eukprot:1158203-Pelagomonas_calceolata.AAC.2
MQECSYTRNLAREQKDEPSAPIPSVVLMSGRCLKVWCFKGSSTLLSADDWLMLKGSSALLVLLTGWRPRFGALGSLSLFSADEWLVSKVWCLGSLSPLSVDEWPMPGGVLASVVAVDFKS